MGKFINNLYKVAAQHSPETTLDSIVDRLLTEGQLTNLPYKFPIKVYLYLTETFDPLQLTKERKIANNIYRSILNYIYNYLPQNERDMIGMYKTYGLKASLPYDIDEHRLTSLYNILDDNNSFDINTEFGKLKIKFCERSVYNVDEDTLLGYDDELKAIIIFVDDGQNITTLDIVNLFLDTNHIYLHELQHYVDDITGNAVKQKYDIGDPIAYLNDPDEVKANIQMILGTFGRFLFKNNKLIEFEKLKDKSYLTNLFNIFLGNSLNSKFTNVINKDTQEMFRKEIFYLNDTNKNEFYKQMYSYISDYYNTEEDIKFDESKKKQELIRLFRLEENFM